MYKPHLNSHHKCTQTAQKQHGLRAHHRSLVVLVRKRQEDMQFNQFATLTTLFNSRTQLFYHNYQNVTSESCSIIHL